MLCTISAACMHTGHGRDFQRAKASFFVHVSSNETYLNGLTMEQLQTDIACLSQCCNVQQLLHRYVGMYEIESHDTHVCLAIGSQSPRIFTQLVSCFMYRITLLSRVSFTQNMDNIDHVCIRNPIFKPREVRR